MAQVSWLEGHLLAQTVFVNLFLHNPAQIEDRLLRTFSYGLLKLVGIVEDIVKLANVFEDVMSTHSMAFLGDFK